MNINANDKLDRLIVLALSDYAKEEAEAFESIDISNSKIDEEFDKRIYRLIERKAKESKKKRVKKITLRIAIAAILITSLMLIAIMSISGLREALWNAIVQWYEDYIAVSFTEPSPRVIDIDTASGDIVVDTSKVNLQKEILEYRKPMLSDEYREEVIFKDESQYWIDYYFNEEVRFSFCQNLHTDSIHKFNSVEKTVKNISVKEFDGILVISKTDNVNTLIWTDGEYIYTISGLLTESKLIKLAETVQ